MFFNYSDTDTKLPANERQMSLDRLSFLRPLNNQRGMALILAISMLAIMSILGAMALSTSSTEVGLSGNYKTTQLAFYSAQRALEYATTNGDIYASIGTGVIDLETGDHPTNIIGGTAEGLGIFEISGDADEGPLDNKVTHLLTGNLPPGSGSDPTYFEARYYLINVTGEGPRNSIARIESQVGRIVPK
ncbi:MAG: hypothetical protein BA864_12825 [Desulfuromonadales bacterium C00003093]|nr:MAG: hypothetical protein BA864_12825 [Desulfuromonadales bacterium C00003093]